ncbi:conserved exported hypothetical protein [Luteimonas sp. 9C]|uniref:hypothetical protein n=1 Tax=Luteimonas sp. 9C TaxID=2653148 RepID=UPI0012F108BA|nr:hypothetical protein [Luteimonas sp. 9C]VXB47239.1 conserved exported hypothetical protein [Luteimonas sp. 9C]
MRADRRSRRGASLWIALALACALGACGRDTADADTTGSGQPADGPLPQPQQNAGGVTGLSGAPGPGNIPLGGEQPLPETGIEEDALAPLEDNPETGLAGVPGETAAPGPEPTPEEAAAVIRTYYAAINALDYPRAYTLWYDGGRASGQPPEQFAAGFGDTSVVMVDIGAPGPVDAAAGSRFIEIPVSLRAQQTDGSSRRFEGRYVLRRAMVDGASDAQRAWRIASADLREVSPAP